MKKIALAAAVIAVAATAAHAGAYVDPIIEPEIIIEDTRSSGSGFIVPLIFLLIVAGVALL